MNKHDETATIPPFGEWDETDPTSGQKFTVIFDKKKEEKNDPSFTFPISAPPKSSRSSNFLRSKRPSPSFYSKVVLFPFWYIKVSFLLLLSMKTFLKL
ncbi:hypothetical protein ERO13_D06G215450v2 [Gossypium hirsutum]|uniref:RIN4 pathogenic type III effector avirulence factor Avr cleavage site domain-containing protein n=1 Tax=Gossypium darwinii TaxID=34276 RepID=A0A5D2CE17_GOSDA|nr:hypothetical protein ERO13_D06G215450v2 [Gossypium hirsutum]TYG66382.1 hypothetical protein ES288_D06G263700v1 [Gossypium darwinii]